MPSRYPEIPPVHQYTPNPDAATELLSLFDQFGLMLELWEPAGIEDWKRCAWIPDTELRKKAVKAQYTALYLFAMSPGIAIRWRILWLAQQMHFEFPPMEVDRQPDLGNDRAVHRVILRNPAGGEVRSMVICALGGSYQPDTDDRRSASLWLDLWRCAVKSRAAFAVAAPEVERPPARLGRLPADEREPKYASFLKLTSHHPTLMNDPSAIAEKLKISPRTVKRWLKAANDTHSKSLDRQRSNGEMAND